MFSAGCARQRPLATPLITPSGLCSPAGAVRDGVFFDVEADFGFGRGRWGAMSWRMASKTTLNLETAVNAKTQGSKDARGREMERERQV